MRKIEALAKRDGWRCHYCSTLTGYEKGEPEPTVDHFVPWSKGGSNALWNQVLACKDCNQDKGDMDGWAYKDLLASRPENWGWDDVA